MIVLGGVETPADPVPSIEAHPVVVWVTIGTLVLVLVTKALASAAPNLSEAISRWRTHKQSREDARIGDLENQVQYLAGRVYVHDQRIQRQDRYLYEHAQWDRQVLQAAIEAGLDVNTIGPPPPLWPPPE